MRKIVLLPVLLCMAFGGYAQGVWKWGKGNTGPSRAEGYYAATHVAGSAYGLGITGGLSYFVTDTLTTAGIYVVKHDSDGNEKWVVSGSSAVPQGVASDRFGNVYVLGVHNALMSF